MGYTHYWTYQPNKIKNTEEVRKRFLQAVCWIDKAHKKIKSNKFIHKGQAGGFYDDEPCIIRGGLGEGKPMINESEIWFNGDAKTEMDHETFGIRWCDNEREHQFTKTNRKPYDVLVCVSLLAMQQAFKGTGAFSFSSDGNNKDWETAKNLFMDVSFISIEEIFPEEANLEH